ncbi:MAG TPA: DUF3857 domain-containing protein [Hanamia sp.]
MKKQILTFLLLFISLIIFAKTELPEYGAIDKTDLQLKECEFDKDAIAYQLMSAGDVYFKVIEGNFNIITERRIRIKILKDSGLKEANIKIRFFSMGGYESIKDISGITYNLDSAGNILTSNLGKSSIVIKKIDDQVSEVSFTLPDVKVGSVFEYKFTDEKKSISNIDNWYFQDDIPTRISVYRVLIPSMFKFSSKLFAFQDVAQEVNIVNETAKYKKSTLNYESQLKTYTLENIPALKKEPFMGAQKDYLQRVVFQLSGLKYSDGENKELSSTWSDITTSLLNNENFGGQLSKNLPHTKKLDEALKYITDDYKKMETIDDFVRKKMKWNGETSIYSSNAIKIAWDKNSGNTADLNLILINLLREAGIKAYPLIASTKNNGTVNTHYPFLQQFNITLAYVEIGDNKYIIDAADKYNPASLVPYNVLNNDAYVVDAKEGGWVVLSNNKNIYKNIVSIVAQINPDDSLAGTATINSYGYAKNEKLKIWEKDTSSFIKYYSASDSTLQIKNIEVDGMDMDSVSLRQKFDFAMPLSSSDAKEYFTINLFQGFNANPFLDTGRVMDIDFNYKRSYTFEGKISIPDDYEFDLPKSIQIMVPDSSIILNRDLKVDSGTLDFRITVDFTKSYYHSNAYPLLQEFYKKLYSALNEKIGVMRKRNS